MAQRINAIFEDGVFRPQASVDLASIDLANGERVSLEVFPPGPPICVGPDKVVAVDGLDGVLDLLDPEFMGSNQTTPQLAPTLEEARRLLSGFTGSLADRVSQERDER